MSAAAAGTKVVMALLAAGLALAGPAHAQQTEPASSLLERGTLTGDWGGLRNALSAKGIDLGLANYGDVFSVVSGGAARRTTYSDLIEPTAAIDLDKLVHWPGARMFVRGIGTYGADPVDSTGSLDAPSSLAGPVDTFKLFEAWLEQRLLDNALSVLVGLYGLDTEFDVKQTAGVFMNGGFGTGLDLSQTGLNGPCIFPVSCLGLRIRVAPTPSLYGQSVVLDGVAGDPDNPYGTRVHLDDDDGALVATEIGYQRGPEERRVFRAALGAWFYTGDFPDLVAVDANGDPRMRHGTHGLYGLVEGELFREPARAQSLSGFLRAGMADDRVNQIGYSVSGGLAYAGLIPRRDDDVVGIAVSVGINGDTFMEARRRAGTPADSEEVALEWTYLARLAPWMRLQLDIQYIINPATDRALDDALGVGLRYKIVF